MNVFLSDINSRFTLQHRYVPDRESFAKLVQIFKKHVKKKVEPSIEAVASGASTGNDQLTSGFPDLYTPKWPWFQEAHATAYVSLFLSLTLYHKHTQTQTTQQVRSGRTRGGLIRTTRMAGRTHSKTSTVTSTSYEEKIKSTSLIIECLELVQRFVLDRLH